MEMQFVFDMASCSSPVVVEMLQSLHSLQQENQRLQDQILSLTAKKERLQLLNTELAISFPPHIHSAHGSMHSAQVHFLSSTQGLILHLLHPHVCQTLGHTAAVMVSSKLCL